MPEIPFCTTHQLWPILKPLLGDLTIQEFTLVADACDVVKVKITTLVKKEDALDVFETIKKEFRLIPNE